MNIEQFQKLIDDLDTIDFSQFKEFTKKIDSFKQLSSQVEGGIKEIINLKTQHKKWKSEQMDMLEQVIDKINLDIKNKIEESKSADKEINKNFIGLLDKNKEWRDKKELWLTDVKKELSQFVTWQTSAFSLQFESLSNKNIAWLNEQKKYLDETINENKEQLNKVEEDIESKSKEELKKLSLNNSLHKHEVSVDLQQYWIENNSWQKSTLKKLNKIIDKKGEELNKEMQWLMKDQTESLQNIVDKRSVSIPSWENDLKKWKKLLTIFIIIVCIVIILGWVLLIPLLSK